MDLLCELLTDNPVGGLNSIPFWMFSICYTFLAAFDCNSNDGTNIFSGYEIILQSCTKDHDYHNKSNLNVYCRSKTTMEPAQINAQNFRKKLIEDWKSCVKFVDAQETSPSSISIDFDRIKQAMDYNQIIQALSVMPEIDKFNETNEDDDNLKKDDAKWKYEIIRRIGAPWSWIYQFVDHCSPISRSYNFYECQHKLYNKEYDENFDVSNFIELDLSGAGPILSTDIIDAFLNYAKSKALENDGIISLKQIKEHENCPPMH